MGSVPNCQKEIPNCHGIRWFKFTLKPPKKKTTTKPTRSFPREDTILTQWLKLNSLMSFIYNQWKILCGQIDHNGPSFEPSSQQKMPEVASPGKSKRPLAISRTCGPVLGNIRSDIRKESQYLPFSTTSNSSKILHYTEDQLPEWAQKEV